MINDKGNPMHLMPEKRERVTLYTVVRDIFAVFGVVTLIVIASSTVSYLLRG